MRYNTVVGGTHISTAAERTTSMKTILLTIYLLVITGLGYGLVGSQFESFLGENATKLPDFTRHHAEATIIYRTALEIAAIIAAATGIAAIFSKKVKVQIG